MCSFITWQKVGYTDHNFEGNIRLKAKVSVVISPPESLQDEVGENSVL